MIKTVISSLGQFFRDNYDKFASKLPYVSSGVNITRIEVWVTNKMGISVKHVTS